MLIKVQTISTENNNHLDIDAIEWEYNTDILKDLNRLLSVLKKDERATISADFLFKYKAQETEEKMQYHELDIYGDKTFVLRAKSKYCGSEIESEFFTIKEINPMVSISEIATGVSITNAGTTEVVAQEIADYDRCPNCNSNDITYGDCDPSGVTIFRNHKCQDCNTSWEETYNLTQVEVSNVSI